MNTTQKQRNEQYGMNNKLWEWFERKEAEKGNKK